MDRKAMQKGPSLIYMRHLCAISLNFARFVDHDSGRNKGGGSNNLSNFSVKERGSLKTGYFDSISIFRERGRKGEGRDIKTPHARIVTPF